jgi:glyoxylase-like metal-dependent hydrolase (beta-lactamase superfamily II)
MTLEGTCTWVLHAPGAPGAVVVDPGPDDAAHRAAVLDAVAADRARVAVVLLTHHHLDHSAGAAALSAATGAPVRAGTGPDRLQDGDAVTAGVLGDLRLRVLATPGHTADSLCLLLPADGAGPAALLTGDTVLGRGSTVVAAPDGALGPHLASLRRLAALLAGLGAQGQDVVLLPGHGPVRADPARAVADLLAHREQRLEQVRTAVAAGARTAAEVVDAVYPGLAAPLRPAAEATAAASLELLGRAPAG